MEHNKDAGEEQNAEVGRSRCSGPLFCGSEPEYNWTDLSRVLCYAR